MTAAEALRIGPGSPGGFWQRAGDWVAWSGAAVRLGGRGPDGRGLRDLARRGGELLAGLEEAPPEVPLHAPRSGVEPGADAPGTRARFYGGSSFSGAVGGGGWRAFGACSFVLPRIEVRAEAGRTWMAGVARVEADRDPEAAREDLGRRLGGLRERLLAGNGAAPLERGDARRGDGEAGLGARLTSPLDRRRWDEIVERALEEIRAGRLAKVVLARPLDVELERPVDPVALLLRLRADHPASFPYLIDPGEGAVFVGAAPEIVAAVRGGRFQATVVAGTCARGASQDEDEALARELLESAKDQEEHALVLRDLRDRLSDLAPQVEADAEPTILRLRELQHLRTEVTASLPGEAHVLEVLERLHPTAAVNGYPREPARAFLRRHEPFERGWYAGPVGWFDAAGDGVFAVALRCGLVQGRRLRLYAGAGIVDGSEAGREWEETVLKFRPVLDALRDLYSGRPGGA
ncbi:MAG: isochorismate synthase [Gemmatimonadota bacterium]